LTEEEGRGIVELRSIKVYKRGRKNKEKKKRIRFQIYLFNVRSGDFGLF